MAKYYKTEVRLDQNNKSSETKICLGIDVECILKNSFDKSCG